MDIYLKMSACVLIAVILYQMLAKNSKDIATLLILLVCTIVATTAVLYITPVIDLLKELQTIGNLDYELVEIVLRSVGIGLLTQIITQICADAGNASLGKILQILSAAIILWISIPLFTMLIDLVQEILIVL